MPISGVGVGGGTWRNSGGRYALSGVEAILSKPENDVVSSLKCSVVLE